MFITKRIFNSIFSMRVVHSCKDYYIYIERDVSTKNTYLT